MSATVETRFLDALRKLRGRTDYLEEMAKWKDDLASRLWRSEAALRVSGAALNDFASLEMEVNAYKLCCDKMLALVPPAKDEEAA